MAQHITQEGLLRIIEQAAKNRATGLDLRSRGLTKLPPEIGQLTNVKWLGLSHNQLTILPPEIGQMTSLTWLDLTGNQLTALPSEIGKLVGLGTLDLSGNQLTSVPPEIGQLVSLRQLDLRFNRLTTLPHEIGSLISLEILYLSDNQIATLPPVISRLTRLEVLDLDINRLGELPSEISQLTQLTWLDLRDNLLPIPPEILERRYKPDAIISYYLQHLIGQKRPLNEAKMLLVGQGSVGKTSLARRLIEDCFDPYENKTEGIDIQRWQVAVNGQSTQLNVWDFGGQEIMHATHQFFLTKRSLYLLVLDTRLGEDENRVEYWLKMIQSFGGESPVIVVGNKIDQQPLDLDRRGLRSKYPQIVEIVETSCQTGEGIGKLKAIIAGQVGTLDHIHDQLLITWFAVKTRLEQMEQDYIPYNEYVRMCQAEGVTDETSQRTLIGFLHDLGVVLNFQDDPRLEDTNILNPEWVTNGVYKILNHPALQSNGILERRQLSQILPTRDYPRDKHLFIMDMLRKFELCFDFEGQKDEWFLIPDLLAKEEPSTGDWNGALAFQYHYNVLPGSVVSRFIVRMHPYIHKNIYWRNGVVLGREGNEALVKADREDKKIYIWVRGPEKTRRELLSSIRAEFGAIHQTIPGLVVAEKVPVSSHPEIEPVDFAYLRDLDEMGETSFVPPGLKQRISVKQLLDGVGKPEQDLRVQLRELLKSFSDNELRDVCFELRMDYEDLPGEGKSGKARELISYLDRCGRLAELVAVGKRLRPDIAWNEP